MKKYLLLVVALVSMLAIAGCGGGDDNTGVFKFTDAEIADGKKLPEKAEQDGVTIQYPSAWKAPEQAMGPAFMITKEVKEGEMPASLTMMKAPSNPAFAKMSADDYKKTYEDTLKAQQIDGLEVVKVEKGKWQGADALYMEYKAGMAGQDFHYSMHYYDNGKEAFTVMVTSSESAWADVQADVKQILASVTFPKK